MRLIIAAIVCFFAAPAFADQSSFPIDFPTCLGVQVKAAGQLQVPLKFSVNTADRRDFSIATDGGVVTIRCDRLRQELTVITPPGVNIAPYINGGGSS